MFVAGSEGVKGKLNRLGSLLIYSRALKNIKIILNDVLVKMCVKRDIDVFIFLKVKVVF